MSISLEQITAFVETVEQGGFRQAGAKLGKHASTVSGLIANLEIDCGFELFIRKPRSLELTEHGRELYQFAKPVMQDVAHFESKIHTLLQQDPTRFHVAIDTALRGPELTRCYQEVLKRFPLIDLKVLCGDPMQVLGWVRSGQADLGLCMMINTPLAEITLTQVLHIELVWVAPTDWVSPGQSLNTCHLRSLTQLGYLFARDLGFNEHQAFSSRLLYVNDVSEMLEMVAAGIGWALVPRRLAMPWLERGAVHEFFIEGEKPYLWSAELMRLASKPLDPAMELFQAQVKLLQDR